VNGFRPGSDGEVEAEFDVVERGLIVSLAEQLIELLDLSSDSASPAADPALARLLPDAYPDDAEASAEFRRFTSADLTQRKIANARAVADSVRGGERASVVLDAHDVQAWLRTLADLRLTLAARLGIQRDGETGRTDDEAQPVQQLYLWCGYLQESLLEAITA